MPYVVREGTTMTNRKLKILLFVSLAMLLSLVISGCDIAPDNGKGGAPHVVPVETTFKELYETLGGEKTLGPAISGLETRDDNLQCQFTETVFMCINSASTDSSRFSLYHLGTDLGIREDSHLAATTAPPGARVVKGFVIYEKFLPLYDKLFGARYVGDPLTDLRINYDSNRIEQFFANVGFYQPLDDPNAPVSLVPYGAYLCGHDCSYDSEGYWSTVKGNLVEQPFAQSIARIGGTTVFGSPLLQPEWKDGYVEQVYTNVVFYAPQDNLSQVQLRPLPQMLGYQVESPATRKSHDQLVFYEFENGLGHNVPLPFDDFMANHGGPDLAGRPLGEVRPVHGSELLQQCFENYCLVYDKYASDPLKVRLSPLGANYLETTQVDDSLRIVNMFSPDRIAVLVSVDKPTIDAGDEQYARMVVLQRSDAEPLERVEATLVLSLEDNTTVRYYLPPTDSNGMAVVVIPPQAGVTHGSRLQYQVCLNLPSEQPICNLGSYLIWNTK
jgi:hypothetical protein